MEENTTGTHSAGRLHTFHTFTGNRPEEVLLSEKRAQILIRSVTDRETKVISNISSNYYFRE